MARRVELDLLEQDPITALPPDTPEAAGYALGHLLLQYAGVKSGDILNPDGSKNVFNARGDFLFNVPKIEVK